MKTGFLILTGSNRIVNSMFVILIYVNIIELVYYGIKVGTCKETELTIDKEFDFHKKKAEVTAESILDGDTQSHNEELYVYDIVLAGVEA